MYPWIRGRVRLQNWHLRSVWLWVADFHMNRLTRRLGRARLSEQQKR